MKISNVFQPQKRIVSAETTRGNTVANFVRNSIVTKGGFFSESAIRFLDLQILKKIYSHLS